MKYRSIYSKITAPLLVNCLPLLIGRSGRPIFRSKMGAGLAIELTMKSRVGLAVSVGLNLGLAGLLILAWSNRPPSAPVPADELIVLDAAPRSGAGTNEVQLRYFRRPDFRFPTNGFPHFTWRAIESADYRRYVDNLRAISCPEKTIQDIIVADVNELYAARWKEVLAKRATEFRYWQTGDGLPGFADDAAESEAAKLDTERKALLKDLLGLDVKDSLTQFGAVNPLELTLNFLPAERRQQVIRAQEEFAARQTALITGAGLDGAIDAAALQKLRDEHQQKLATLMTPEELRRYEMTTSPLAMALRSELAGFEPTEAEFQQIYESRKQLDGEVEATRVFLGAQIEAQEAADAAARKARVEQAQAQAVLLEQLGSQRYAALQRTTDPNYQLLVRVSRTSEVSLNAVNRVYELQQIAQVEANKVRANSAFSLEQREVALNGIRAETERTIRDTFGETAWQTFRDWNEQQARERELVTGGR